MFPKGQKPNILRTKTFTVQANTEVGLNPYTMEEMPPRVYH